MMKEECNTSDINGIRLVAYEILATKIHLGNLATLARNLPINIVIASEINVASCLSIWQP